MSRDLHQNCILTHFDSECIVDPAFADCSLLKNSIQGLPVTIKLASFSPRTLGDMAVEAHDHLLDISPWVSGSLAEDGPHGRDSYAFCALQKWPSQPIYRYVI
jgi:hypothetical protein